MLKYSENVLPDTLNPLKHIGTTTNCTTIGTFTLPRIFVTQPKKNMFGIEGLFFKLIRIILKKGFSRLNESLNNMECITIFLFENPCFK